MATRKGRNKFEISKKTGDHLRGDIPISPNSKKAFTPLVAGEQRTREIAAMGGTTRAVREQIYGLICNDNSALSKDEEKRPYLSDAFDYLISRVAALTESFGSSLPAEVTLTLASEARYVMWSSWLTDNMDHETAAKYSKDVVFYQIKALEMLQLHDKLNKARKKPVSALEQVIAANAQRIKKSE